MAEIEVCKQCGEPFEVTEMSAGGAPGNMEPESIDCHECGNSYERMSRGYFQTSKLTPAQRAEWEKSRAKKS